MPAIEYQLWKEYTHRRYENQQNYINFFIFKYVLTFVLITAAMERKRAELGLLVLVLLFSIFVFFLAFNLQQSLLLYLISLIGIVGTLYVYMTYYHAKIEDYLHYIYTVPTFMICSMFPVFALFIVYYEVLRFSLATSTVTSFTILGPLYALNTLVLLLFVCTFLFMLGCFFMGTYAWVLNMNQTVVSLQVLNEQYVAVHKEISPSYHGMVGDEATSMRTRSMIQETFSAVRNSPIQATYDEMVENARQPFKTFMSDARNRTQYFEQAPTALARAPVVQ